MIPLIHPFVADIEGGQTVHLQSSNLARCGNSSLEQLAMQIFFLLCQTVLKVCQSSDLDLVGIQMKAREEHL